MIGCRAALGLGLRSLGVAWPGACGGTAVIDGSSGGSGDDGQGGSPLCATPAPVGALTTCGGSVSPTQCSAVLCDEAGNRWETSCRPSGCSCLYNGQLRCSCATDGPGHPCDGFTPPCCPSPFSDVPM